MWSISRDADAQAPVGNPELRPQVFNLAWQVYSKSPAELINAIGSNAEARAEFAKYLLERNQFETGLNIWRAFSASDKQANSKVAEGLIKILVDAKHFPQALEIWNDLGTDDMARGKVGQVLDGGFDRDSSGTRGGVFGWQVRSGQQVQATFDSDVKHGGTHSLRLVFKARSNLDVGLSQLVVVEPGTQYDFAGFVKTSKLESAGTPVIEIVDAADASVLGTSQPAPAGFNDWQRMSIAFKTGSKTVGIMIRINRASCGDNSSCPIFGTLWYDDFDIKRRG